MITQSHYLQLKIIQIFHFAASPLGYGGVNHALSYGPGISGYGGHHGYGSGIHAYLSKTHACRATGGECVTLDNCDLTLNVYKDG